MPTITRTPKNRWKAVIRRQGWPAKARTFRTKRDAEDWARRTEDDMVRGVYLDRGPSTAVTLERALDRYLKEVTPTKRPGTQALEHTNAKRLKAMLGKYSLAALTPDIIASYRDARLAEGRAANTVRLELATLSHLFKIAIQEWRLGLFYNPVRNIRKPSPGTGRSRRVSLGELRRLLRACHDLRNPMLGWIVRIALETGMRAGEILSLRCHQVDLTRRVARLDRTKNGSARTVPLTQKAVRYLDAALGNPLRPKDTDLVFFGENGRKYQGRRPYEFRPAWYITLSKAKIKDLHFHDLRHEAVSRLVEAGLSDQEVSAISGHRSMQMLRRYTHLRAEDLVARLDEVRVRKNGPHPLTKLSPMAVSV